MISLLNLSDLFYPTIILFAYFLSAHISDQLHDRTSRIVKIFSLSSIARIFRYGFVLYTVLLCFYSARNSKNSFQTTFQILSYSGLEKIQIQSFFLIVVLVIIYILYHSRIRTNLKRHEDYRIVNFVSGLWQFILSSGLGIVFVGAVFLLAFWGVNVINEWFNTYSMDMFDWKNIKSNTEQDFKKGFYFAFLLSAACSLAFISSMAKLNNESSRTNPIFKAFLLTIIFFFSLLSGIYSVANSYYNIRSLGSIMIWFKSDNVLGLLTLRLASITLFWQMFAFLIKNVFRSGVIEFFNAIFSPHSQTRLRDDALSHRVHSTTFILQIGFYLLNLLVSELAIIFNYESIIRSFLNVILLTIVDDYLIIHTYTNTFNQVIKKHKIKVLVFNILLLFGGIMTLFEIRNYGFLFIYIVSVVILAYVNFENQNRPKEV